MMSPNLNELNTRFANIGLAIHVDPAGAAQLKNTASRERVLHALSRVENHNDAGARVFLEKTLRAAGVAATNGSNGQPPQASSQRPPQATPRNEAPAQPAATTQHPPERPAVRRSAPPYVHDAAQAGGNAESCAERRPRPQHHVYGGRAALTFELDETPAGAPTVALDGANSIGERKFDWQNKVRIQFTTRELPVVAATLLGILPQCQFSNHGPANDKGFEIAWQSERQSFFVKVWQGKGNLRAVPMPREDAFYAAQLVLRAIQQGSPARLDTAGVIATLRAFYARA